MQQQSKKVYLSGNVIYAFIDRSHPKHDMAASFFRYFAENGYHVFTDIVTITGVHDRISSDMSLTVGKEFLKTMTQSSTTILYPEEKDFHAATKLYIADRTAGLVFETALIAVLADKRGISQVATFDFLHAVYGLKVFYLPM